LILQKLQRDLEALTSPEGYLYAGLPKFRGLFGRDVLISGWQLLHYDPSIARSSLLALAKLQGQKINPEIAEEPGKILHEFYSLDTSGRWWQGKITRNPWLKKGVPFYFSVDSTPLFLFIAAEYYRQTGEKEFIESIKENIVSALDWLFDYGMIDGFLRYGERSKEEGLVSQSWKDGIGHTLEEQKSPVAIVEVQGYLFQALEEISKIGNLIGRDKRGLEETNKDLKDRFHEKFYMEDRDFYCLGIDGDNKQIKRITSNPGQLLFTEIIDKDQADLIVKRLFKDDMWTPYGIRTHSTQESDFDPLSYQRGAVWPHDNWIIAQGLLKRGYTEEAQQIKEALFLAYSDLGERIPEYYGVSLHNKIIIENLKTPPCYPQAWSVGAMINFLTRK